MNCLELCTNWNFARTFLLSETENIRTDYRRRNEELQHKVEEIRAAASSQSRSPTHANAEAKEAVDVLDRKIRATKMVYQDFKKCLGEFLVQVRKKIT